MLIAQITDTHIMSRNQHWYSEETKTAERLSRAVSCINGMNPLPDVVLLTGDATDRGDPLAYHHLKELLKPLKPPVYLIPGNHDSREEMRKAFFDGPYMTRNGYIQYAIEDYPVRLIGLDTLVEGEGYGRICEERYSWLEKTLEAQPNKPTLVFMHHPIVKTGNKIFDKITCLAHPNFEALLKKSDQVLSLLTGHYHHFCVSSFGGKICFTAPSVAPVHFFIHREDDKPAAIELEDPAVSLHEWHGGASFTSHIVRVKEQVIRLNRETLNHSR